MNFTCAMCCEERQEETPFDPGLYEESLRGDGWQTILLPVCQTCLINYPGAVADEFAPARARAAQAYIVDLVKLAHPIQTPTTTPLTVATPLTFYPAPQIWTSPPRPYGAYYTITRQGQEKPRTSDWLCVRVSIHMPAPGNGAIPEELVFGDRVKLNKKPLDRYWGWKFINYYRTDYIELARPNWSMAFAAAWSYAEDELARLDKAIVARQKALADAELPPAESRINE